MYAGCSFLGFCSFASTLARIGVDDPCPQFPFALRIMYGLFGTRITHLVLGHVAHTKKGLPQTEQVGGTQPTLTGEAETGSSLRVAVLPVLQGIFGGNYAYVVYNANDALKRATVVDGADPEVVLRYLDAAGLTLTHILTTHWHWDHSGGNRKLSAAWPDAAVVCGREEYWRVPAAGAHLVAHGDSFEASGLSVKCHGLRGHTRGSICYELNVPGASAPPALFTGDALFIGGCGALFEGSASVMYSQLGRLFEALAPDALLFPGHEYAVMLLQQAVQREPQNQDAKRKLRWATARRQERKPTVSSKLGEELTYNGWAREAAKRGDFGLFCQLCGVGDFNSRAVATGAKEAAAAAKNE